MKMLAEIEISERRQDILWGLIQLLQTPGSPSHRLLGQSFYKCEDKPQVFRANQVAVPEYNCQHGWQRQLFTRFLG